MGFTTTKLPNRAKSCKNHIWIYGRHACISALQNPNRVCKELFVTDRFLRKCPEVKDMAQSKNASLKKVEPVEMDGILGFEAAHQGILLRVKPIFGGKNSGFSMENIVSGVTSATSTIVILDRITDVNNVGAIVRSAACFDVDAVVLPRYHAPSENCSIAKISSGAADFVPVVQSGNLVKTMDYLKQEGYWCYGLDSLDGLPLHEANFSERRAIVLGSEGNGMRRLVRERCDYIVRIPMSRKIDSLNVSNAAAIALYSIYTQCFGKKSC